MTEIGGENYFGENQEPEVAFEVFAHTDKATGEIFLSPFPVVVFGVNNEFFGLGVLLGKKNDNPVIEVYDRDDGQPYQLTGDETWWKCPVPEEIIEKLASGLLFTDSVAEYRRETDEYLDAVEMQDNAFLRENGIDPDL